MRNANRVIAEMYAFTELLGRCTVRAGGSEVERVHPGGNGFGMMCACCSAQGRGTCQMYRLVVHILRAGHVSLGERCMLGSGM